MITLQQLKYFKELAKTSQLTDTANRLFITQTTLSNTIINLEKQLGVKLFDRVGRSLKLNEMGEKYYEYINEALMLIDNAQSFIDDYKKTGDQKVSVAMTSSSVWGNTIRDFKSCYRSYNIHQINCDYAQFRSMLINQEIDFIIAGIDDLSLSGLEYKIIRHENIYLCVPYDHPFANKKSISLTETEGEEFITLPRSSAFRHFCDSIFEKLGIACKTSIECDYTMRGKLIEAGFGITLCTSFLKEQKLFGENVAYIPVTDEVAKRPIAIIWNGRHYLSRAAEDFKNYVIENNLG